MATRAGGVILDMTKLEGLLAHLRPSASKVVETYGLAITSEAARNAPLQFGALRNSITSESHMENDLLFIVQDGVEYGVFQEFGTSKMAAQPFLIPAIETWRDRYFQAFAKIFEQWK